MLLSEIDLNPGGRGSGPGIGVLAPIIRGIDREETKRKMKRRKEGGEKGEGDVARVRHGALPGESTYISLVG